MFLRPDHGRLSAEQFGPPRQQSQGAIPRRTVLVGPMAQPSPRRLRDDPLRAQAVRHSIHSRPSPLGSHPMSFS